MAHGTALVLYVHPSGHLNDLVVPAGALSCMNAISAPKIGRYAFEVTDEEIRAAKVVAVDVHWALSLPGFERFVEHVRSIHSTVPIVVGGVTAGHYPAELLARYAIDYVVQGDSEASFAQLIEHLVRGESPPVLPNVHSRDRRATITRMTAAQFDDTDPITADWFPTYEKHSNWDAAAFPQGRTITVSRGCAFRCPECYGSYASTYGRGYHLRSPERLARLVERCARLGLRNLRLFLAKPPDGRLTELLRALCDAGPFRFSSTVGFYLCTAPSIEDLDLLEAAFETPVALSMIPPHEHVPAVRPKRLALEEERWRRAAERIARSHVLTLDAWSTTSSDLVRIRSKLTDRRTDRVKVSYGAVWSVTRPVEGETRGFDEVRNAMLPVWTFYAGRVLSPSIAKMLLPYRYLDELEGDVDDLACSDEALRGWFDASRRSWAAHHLPYLPGLRFSVVPRRGRVSLHGGSRHGVELGGALCHVEPSEADHDAAVPLIEEHDHRGTTLSCAIETTDGVTALVIVPHPLPDGAIDADWLSALSRDGVVALRVPAGVTGRVRVRLVVRVQGVQALLLDDDDEELASGRGGLGYYRIVRAPRQRD